ncbi:MAG: hypothetical protein AB8H03_02730 [Saprospiraceae bacterium]
MGWKASMLIIQNTSGVKTAEEVIEKVEHDYYELAGETTLESCINPRDKSIYIGFYKENIIVTMDAEYVLMSIIEGEGGIEDRFNDLCPGGEIMGVFCQSTTNMHGYFLNKDGDRVRHKMISFEGPRLEYGERFEEEIEIYKDAKKDENGVEYWSYGENDSDRYEENQLMENFTFGVAKRLLGVQLDHTEGEDLMFQVKFKKFVKAENPAPKTEKKVEESNKKSDAPDTPNTTYQRPERTTARKKRTTTPLSTEQSTSENFEPPSSHAEPKPTPSKTTPPKLKNENGLNLSWSTIAMFIAGLYLLYKLLN